jgi:hypothetical protein
MPKEDEGQGFTFSMTTLSAGHACFAGATWPTETKIESTSAETEDPWKTRYRRMKKAEAAERKREKAEAAVRECEKKDRQSRVAAAMTMRAAADRLAFDRAMAQLNNEDEHAESVEWNKNIPGMVELGDKEREKEIVAAPRLVTVEQSSAVKITGRERALARMRARKKQSEAAKMMARFGTELLGSESKNRICRLLIQFRENCRGIGSGLTREVRHTMGDAAEDTLSRLSCSFREGSLRDVRGTVTGTELPATCLATEQAGWRTGKRDNTALTAMRSWLSRTMMNRVYRQLADNYATARERFTGGKEVRARVSLIEVSGGSLAGHAAPRDERMIGRKVTTDNRAAVRRVMKGIAGLLQGSIRGRNKTGKKKKRRIRMRAEGLGSQGGQVPPAAGERERAANAEGLGPWDRRMPPAAGREDGWNMTEGIPKVRWDK